MVGHAIKSAAFASSLFMLATIVSAPAAELMAPSSTDPDHQIQDVLKALTPAPYPKPPAVEIPMQPWSIDHFNRTDSEVDVSFLLDAPAGKYGHVQVRDGHFYLGDTEKRFRAWGVNLTAWNIGASLAPPKDVAALWARQMARYGINCVRFHFLDKPARPLETDDSDTSRRWRAKGLIRDDLDHTQEFDAETLDRFDYFCNELKKQGIYINLNLNVGRSYKEGDQVPDWEIIQRASSKGMTYIGPRLLELQRDYAKQLLTHRNPYTGTTYAEEPAVAFVEIVNENSLLEFWSRNWFRGELQPGGENLQLDFSPYYEQILTRMYQEWLAANKSARELRRLRELAGVAPGADIPRTQREDFRNTPDELFHAEAEFLMQTEEKFFTEMRDYLTGELGVKANIIATADHTYFIPPQPLVRTTSKFAAVDGHVYWEHPGIWGRRNTPMVNDPLASTVVKLSRTPVAGKPYTVSEVNHPNPNEFAAEMIPILASYGAFYDWDGIYFYTFEVKYGDQFKNFVADNFDIAHDPVKMTQMSVGALLFSRPDVSPARETVIRNYTAEQVYESNRLPNSERPFFTPGFPLSVPLRHATRIGSFDGPATKKFPGFDLNPPYISDTGELKWFDSQTAGGVVTIDTPRTNGLVGFLRDNREHTVTHMTHEIKNDFAAITLSSLTDQPLWETERMLLITASRWQNTGSKWNERRTNWGRGNGADEDWGGFPTLIEPVTGYIILRDMDGVLDVKAIPLDGAARPMGDAIPAKMVEDGWELKLGEPATNWYLVKVSK